MSVDPWLVPPVWSRLLCCVDRVIQSLPCDHRERAESEVTAGRIRVIARAEGPDLLLQVHLGDDQHPFCATWLADLGAHVLLSADDRPELVLLEAPIRTPLVTSYDWPVPSA